MYDYAIFVQARLGSTRFPQKVAQALAGKRVLDHVLDSCIETGLKTILLCPETDLAFFKKEFLQTEVFAGSEQDVLRRFYECAVYHGVRNVVRITSDCPCLPASHVLAVVEEHQKDPRSFVSNVSYDEGTYESKTLVPDGFDVEVFDFATLEKAHLEATDPADREHVTKWMRRNTNVRLPKLILAMDSGKFSLDMPSDLPRLESLMSILRSFTTVRIDD